MCLTELLPPFILQTLRDGTPQVQTSLGDEKSVNFHTQTLNEIKKNLCINKKKVADHDHLTGQFRGAAHNYCNLTCTNPRFIPIFFHNLAGYDAHLFIKEFGEDDGNIKLIPNTEEKYISFSKILKYGEDGTIELRFVDSFKFLSSSLDKLAKNIGKDQFKELYKYFPKEHLDLITRKLAYSYEYMDSPKEACLPPIEEFCSSLNKENVAEEEYQNAQNIWKTFNIKDLQEFIQLYNKIRCTLISRYHGEL